MTMTFNAIDVETANCDSSSICSIGIVSVRDGKIANKWQTLVNPKTWFDPFNISIHGIRRRDVKHSPTLPMVYDELCSQVNDSILVSHGSFDRTAFTRAMEYYDLGQLQVTWLNSVRIARRAWPEKYGRSGAGLENIARDLGISFRHHDALEDARAAVEVVLRACKVTGIDIEGWLRRVEYPIFPSQSTSSKPINREGNVDGALYGETVVFTGTLKIPRRQAADLAAAAGCDVVDNISKKVTMLMVGTHNVNRLRDYEKSSKHRKVEELIKTGVEIKILSEDDFFNLMDVDSLK